MATFFIELFRKTTISFYSYTTDLLKANSYNYTDKRLT